MEISRDEIDLRCLTACPLEDHLLFKSKAELRNRWKMRLEIICHKYISYGNGHQDVSDKVKFINKTRATYIKYERLNLYHSVPTYWNLQILQK